jgi:hypothetical protein
MSSVYSKLSASSWVAPLTRYIAIGWPQRVVIGKIQKRYLSVCTKQETEKETPSGVNHHETFLESAMHVTVIPTMSASRH